ncbi:MAG: DUF4416 family protein [Phycisphaerae bacterium]|nr:DUF4416 family protein [Phycisphaerae bacterium]
MAHPKPPQPARLICGMIASETSLFDEVLTPLRNAFGAVDILSEVYPFDLTHYYAAQMGDPLWRQFVSFDEPVCPDVLADAKCCTNAIEADVAQRHADGPDRPINLDVGLIAPSKLILASMKDFSHRIYLSHGVWAEVTLIYRNQHWQSLDWTFPDYASGRYDAFLTRARDAIASALRNCTP